MKRSGPMGRVRPGLAQIVHRIGRPGGGFRGWVRAGPAPVRRVGQAT